MPGRVYIACTAQPKEEVVRPMGFPQEAHTGLLGGAVPFSAITGFAGRYEVFPGVFSPVAAGNNMVYGQTL
jgi:hypothetical protein